MLATHQDREGTPFATRRSAFNILGFKTRKAPLTYEARILFGYRRDGLSFPTKLRSDTRRAVSPTQLVAVKASTRVYNNYLFIHVRPEAELGDVVPPD